MIITNLNTCSQLNSLDKRLKILFDFITTNDIENMPLGKIKIQGDEIFINNVELDCKSPQKVPIEMHRDYIDVHILFQGEETIGWKNINDLNSIFQAYDKISDCALSSDRATTYYTLHPLDIAIAFPIDGHAPAIGEGKIRKAIGKVLIK